jgi:hypothetical protein
MRLKGVATGVQGLNQSIKNELEECKNNLAAKTLELEEANKRHRDLQRKVDAIQP